MGNKVLVPVEKSAGWVGDFGYDGLGHDSGRIRPTRGESVTAVRCHPRTLDHRNGMPRLGLPEGIDRTPSGPWDYGTDEKPGMPPISELA